MADDEEFKGLMVTMMRRRSRRRAAQRPPALGEAALEYAAMGWPVCPGVHSSRGLAGTPEPGRACSCDRVGCPAPGAHPVSPTWQMQATVDGERIRQWWEARPEANVILVTGRVFDVLDVPAVAGATALAALAAADVQTGPVAVQLSPGGPTPRPPRGMPDGRASVSGMRSAERMLFFVATRGAPADEDEWWSCGLDSSPDMSVQLEGVRWHSRDSYVLAPPSRYGDGQDVRWVRQPAGLSSPGGATPRTPRDVPDGRASVPGTQWLPDALRLLEFLVDACEEESSYR
jgi:Bifunctional DNA primase/polymerase, N-terminal